MKKMDSDFLCYAAGVLGDTNRGLKNEEIDKYLGKYAVKFDAKKMKNVQLMQSKKEKIFHNFIRFTEEQKYEIIDELCSLERFSENDEVHELRNMLREKYYELAPDSIEKSPVIQETKHWLSDYPAALKPYNSALSKFSSKIFERNTLDDMRLAFELLIKDLLNNNRSLENQIADIGSMLKSAGASVEIRNMVTQIIKYYTDFQNHHVKHNDAVNSNELEYVIELTSVIMKFLVKIKGRTK